jgi:heme-degrading monooxygenase HmoA
VEIENKRGDNTFARVNIGQAKPEQIEAVIRNFQERVGPASKKMAGFKGSYSRVNGKSGNILEIALWDTEEILRASTQAADRLRTGVSQVAAITEPPAVEIYEVAVQL